MRHGKIGNAHARCHVTEYNLYISAASARPARRGLRLLTQFIVVMSKHFSLCNLSECS